MSGAADGSAKVWDFDTCNLLHSLQINSTNDISSVSIGSNGKLIVSHGQRLGHESMHTKVARGFLEVLDPYSVCRSSTATFVI